MQKNTVLFIGFLAVFAALVVGVNLGRSFSSPSQSTVNSPTIQLSPNPAINNKQSTIQYTSDACGIALQYPSNLTVLEGSASGAMFTNPESTQSGAIALICQKNIPRPPLADERIEDIQIGSISAKLYHDGSGKDGTPFDALIFRHPTKKLDVYLSGFGDMFDEIRKTITLTSQ